MKKVLSKILHLSLVVSLFFTTINYIKAVGTDTSKNIIGDYNELKVINPVSNCFHVTSGTSGDGGADFAFDNNPSSHWHTNYQSGNSETNKQLGQYTRGKVSDIPEFKDIKDSRIYLGGSFETVTSVKRFTYKSRLNGNNEDGIEQWALYTTAKETPETTDFKLAATGTFASHKNYEHYFNLPKSVDVKHFRIVVFTWEKDRQATASEIKFFSESFVEPTYYYNFEMAEGNIVKDVMGTGRNGTMGATATLEDGISGKALSVTSANEHGFVIDTDDELGNAWTVSYWMNITAPLTGKTCELMDKDLNYAFSVKMDSGRDSGFRVGQGGGDVLTMSYGYVQNNWYHLTWTQQPGTGIKMYVNGKYIQSNSWTSTREIKCPIDVIGATGFTGMIDEVKAYNKVLTQEQIQDNMRVKTSYSENLALNKTASAKFEGGSNDGASAINGGRTADIGVDGVGVDKEKHTDFNTPSDESVKSYFEVDLQKIECINKIKLLRYYDGRDYNNTVIVASPNSSFDRESGNWSVIYNEDRDNHFGFGVGNDPTYNEDSQGKEFNFDSIPARYVRVYMKGSNQNQGNHIVELQVFGTKNAVQYHNEDTGMLRESNYDGTTYELTSYDSSKTAFIKYVDNKVMTVKAQTELVNNGANVNVRFVSSIPSKNLDGLRFKIEVIDQDGTVRKTGIINTVKAYKRIVSKVDNKLHFNDAAEVFDTSASQYFFVSKLNNVPTNETCTIKVTPYWLPHGATEDDYVQGTSRTFSIEELVLNAN